MIADKEVRIIPCPYLEFRRQAIAVRGNGKGPVLLGCGALRSFLRTGGCRSGNCFYLGLNTLRMCQFQFGDSSVDWQCVVSGRRKENGMAELSFEDKIRSAIRLVVNGFPNREVDASGAAQVALNLTDLEGEERKRASRIILRLARSMPAWYSADRKPGYWRIVLQYFSPEEAVRLYLGQFPKALTEGERRSIKAHLAKVAVRFESILPAIVEEAMNQFTWRRLVGQPQPRSRSHAGFVK